jgi:ABC-type lipoprotein export system ATPase subunit
MATLIEIQNLAKSYTRGKQKVEVLHHVNLDIAEGDFLALMGPSGSGKTTLLNLIGGLIRPAPAASAWAASASTSSAAARWRNGVRRMSVSSSSSTT